MPNCFFGKQDVNVALLSDEEMDITAQLALKKARSEERRVGKECGS